MSGERSTNNIILHEFIGLHTTIINSPCPSYINIDGQIIDETMNTFKIEYNRNGTMKIITVPKHRTIFRFVIPSNKADTPPRTVEIEGSILTKRPEDRIKKLMKLVNKKKRMKQANYKSYPN